MLRKLFFWAHLVAGVTAGLVILMMSVTGVILTYERQILAAAEKAYYSEAAGRQRLSLDELATSARAEAGFSPSSLTIAADPEAPVVARAGRADKRYMNPFTGEFYAPKGEGLEEFFGVVTRIHRWFNAGAESRDTARAVTGISNLVFLFLVLSGLFLWLPSIYRWAAFRMRLLIQAKASGAARDFNWHHVFGIWFAIPLLVIVATATVFNYSWANNLVYRLAGEEPPTRGGPPGGGREQGLAEASAPVAMLPLEQLFTVASSHLPGWQAITINLPGPEGASTVAFSIDQGNGGQPQKRHNLSLDSQTGEVAEWAPFSSQSAGRQARSWVRFLHTGEALGIVGQTIAGLASLAGVLMVWTGLALALRRFRRYLARNKRQRASSTAADFS